MARAFIGIGSNVGDRDAAIALARQRLGTLPRSALTGFSAVYRTAPVGPVEQDDFLNAAAMLETELSPREVLQQLRRIELDAGRPDPGRRPYWGPRPLDLDLLFYDQQMLRETDLEVPHPRLHQRWFVLKPLCDLDPQLRHPVLKRTVADLLAEVERQPTRQVGGPSAGDGS